MKKTNSNRGWAVVTGASSGVGREFAAELASRGYRVLAVARRKEQFDSLVQQVQTAGGIAVARAADLRTREGVAAVSQNAARLGNVELLVNNAAVASGGNFGTSPLESEVGSIQLNTEALVSLTHVLLPQMHFFERNTGLLGALPSLTSDQVVRAALRSLEVGRVVTIVGFVNRALVFFNRLVPRFVMRRIMAVIAHPPPSDLASAGLQA